MVPFSRLSPGATMLIHVSRLVAPVAAVSKPMNLPSGFRIPDEDPTRAEVILHESATVGDWYEAAGVVVLEDLYRARVGDRITVAGMPRVVIRSHAQVRVEGPIRTRIEFVDVYPAE